MHTISKTPSIRGPDGGFRALGGAIVRGPGAVLMRMLNVLLTWQERAAQRHALGRLDDRMLADLGLSRVDVAIELSKPFWRP